MLKFGDYIIFKDENMKSLLHRYLLPFFSISSCPLIFFSMVYRPANPKEFEISTVPCNMPKLREEALVQCTNFPRVDEPCQMTTCPYCFRTTSHVVKRRRADSDGGIYVIILFFILLSYYLLSSYLICLFLPCLRKRCHAICTYIYRCTIALS